MFYGVLLIGALWGNILALFAAICFSIFTIILRMNKNIDMLPCLLMSGVIAIALSLFQKWDHCKYLVMIFSFVLYWEQFCQVLLIAVLCLPQGT